MRPVYNAEPSEGLKVTVIQCRFFGLVPLRTEMSPDSMNLLMILRIVDGEISKILAVAH